MAKKDNKKDKRKNDEENSFWSLKDETKNSIFAVLFFSLSVLFLLAGFGKAGVAGEDAYKILSYLLGIGYFLIPSLFLLLSVSFIRSTHHQLFGLKTLGGVLFFVSGLTIIELLREGSAGVLGKVIVSPLVSLLDFYASLALLFGILLISVLILFDLTLKLPTLGLNFKDQISKLFGKKANDELNQIEPVIIGGEAEEYEEGQNYDENDSVENTEPSREVRPERQQKEGVSALAHWKPIGKPYVPPPLSLLEKDKGKPGVGDIKANATIIKRTLQNFGISVEMDEVTIGPTVTRYAMKPAEGVKLSRIVALQNDLALALAAHPIRIEAPIPGKSLVGIEIPNTVKSTVGLGTLFGSEEFQNSDKPLYIGLGRGISGKSHFGNLAKMPHLLVAGATGSGKSVSIHAIITSLLYRNSPENLRFIMIDPKRVELTLYNKIPHLLTPVITDPKKAIVSLKWAVKEMSRRYDILESESVRDIESYQKNILIPALQKLEKVGLDERDEYEKSMPAMMPYIVIVIDEMADIMQTFPRELEAAVVRLAQMSRAVGIHLILSTQRPSVNVITGLIKANIPARVALQVASQVDSRTILDGSGAEKLLGAGDMLYLSGEMSQPIRIQSAFISESEVKKVVRYLSDAWKDEIPFEINFDGESDSNGGNSSSNSFDEDEEDPKYEEAKKLVLESGKASTSLLQRRLGLGYARAARVIDKLEDRGIIGKGEGSKPREVFGATPRDDKEDLDQEEKEV